MKEQKKEMTNIVIITDRGGESISEHCILIRTQPRIYNKYNCIKIQVTANLLDFADIIIRRFYWLGLEEILREKKSIKTLGGYELKDAYEITLRKIGVLEARGQDD